MASRLIVLTAVVVACSAGPVWFIDNGAGVVPTVWYREARAPVFTEPSIAYGFGSGFSSNIAGINHNSAIGASFQSGNAQAYGSGGAGSDGTSFARGVGYANANPAPAPQIYRTAYPYAYNPYNGLRNSYGVPVTAAQAIGNSATAQTYNAPYNFRGAGYGSAAASNGYGSAATSSADGSGTAISSAQNRDALGGSNTVVSATQVLNGVVASTAHSTQQQGGYLKHAGATTYKGRGIEASHSSVINTSPEYY